MKIHSAIIHTISLRHAQKAQNLLARKKRKSLGRKFGHRRNGQQRTRRALGPDLQ
jgi:hypothetical protein